MSASVRARWLRMSLCSAGCSGEHQLECLGVLDRGLQLLPVAAQQPGVAHAEQRRCPVARQAVGHLPQGVAAPVPSRSR